MAEIQQFNLRDLVTRAEGLNGMQQQNRLRELLTPLQQRDAQLSNQQAEMETAAREAQFFLSAMGDVDPQGADPQAINQRWMSARNALAQANGDIQGLADQFDPQQFQQIQGLARLAPRTGGASGIQSTYVDADGNRVAIFRDGTTRILGKAETSFSYQDDLGGLLDRRTGGLYAPGQTPMGRGPTQAQPQGSGAPMEQAPTPQDGGAGVEPTPGGGALTPEDIRRRQEEEDQRKIRLKEQEAAAVVRGKSSAERALGQTKAGQKVLASVTQIDNVISTIDEAQEAISALTVGPVGSVLSAIPGTPARDLEKQVLTIKANLGFDRLQQMRDLSPTGGALGQVAVQELEALQSSLQSLDTSLSPSQLRSNLRKIRMHYANWRDATVEAYAEQYGETPPVASQPPGEQDIDALINKWGA